VIALFSLIFMICSLGEGNQKFLPEGTTHVPSWDFRVIGKGPLALRDNLQKEAPSLLRALAVRAKNTRPDISYHPNFPQMLLEIKGSSRPRAAISGQKLFLHWEPSHAGEVVRNGPPAPLNWSAEASCFSLTPFVFSTPQDAGTVFFTASLADEEGKQAEEIPFLIEAKVEDDSDHHAFSGQKEIWWESLSLAQFWTKDLFLDLYGTRDSRTSGSEIKIALETKEGTRVLCAHEGDFLVYQDEGCPELHKFFS